MSDLLTEKTITKGLLCLVAMILMAPVQADLARGVVNPAQQALVSSEMRGKIRAIPFKVGDRFDEGDLLVAFECKRTEAELEAARAERKIRRLNAENTKRLQKLNAASELDTNVAQAEFEKADALTKVKQAQVELCNIQAPYAGSIQAKHANVNEVATYNQQLLNIVGVDVQEIVIIVPSDWIRHLKVGQDLEFTVEETGETHPVLVSRLSPQVDTLSQTLTIYARFESRDAKVLPGMSGMAKFQFDPSD